MRVDQRRPAALAAIRNRLLADGIALKRIGAVAFGNMQIRKAAREFRNAAAGGLYLDGDGNGIAVVFDEIQERELFAARDVEGLPELALARCSIATGHVDDLIALVTHVFSERRLFGLRQGFGTPVVVERGLGCANGLHELRARAG